MFTNAQLKKMIIPLFVEQFLVLLVGISDTFMVSYAGEAAVSGVSLVNSFNTIFIYIFTALASGGAVVISQYIGNKDNNKGSEASSQLLMFSTAFSIILTVLVLLGGENMLGLLFGRVETSVMEACMTYLYITAVSFPFLAIYNAGASVYRSMGRTKETMYISVISNLINIIGNAIGVFVLKAGVAGVAWPSTIARIVSAIMMTRLCMHKENAVYFRKDYILEWNGSLLRKIFSIAVPNGVENGIFQLVKVALSSIVALFGTYQIAANGVAQTIWSLASVCSSAMGPVFITVIGQCMGSKDTDAAEYYFGKLLKINFVMSIVWNALIFAITPLMMPLFNLENETKQLIIILVLIHNIFNAIMMPFSGSLGNGLRAAGDVKFTMYVSVGSTLIVRLILSYVFALTFNMGVIGIAFAMCADWTARAIIFYIRYRKGTWKNFSVI